MSLADRFLGIFRKKEKVAFLSEKRLSELIFLIEGREAKGLLPNLQEKIGLEVAPNLKPLSILLKEKGARLVVRLGGTREKEMASGAESSTAFIHSRWETLPLLSDSLDFVWLRTAFLQGGLSRLLQETSRVLKPHGTVLLSNLHPFRRIDVQGELGFENYFKMSRSCHFQLQDVREVFLDNSLRRFFASGSPKERKGFEVFRKTPLLIFLTLTMEGLHEG